MLNLKRVTVLSLAVIAGGFQSACAVSLLPGGDTPLSGTDLLSRPELAGTVIASASRSLVGLDTFNNVRFTGTLTIEVVRETVAGTLDFYYQLTNDSSSTDSMKRLTTTNFETFATDVDFRTDSTGTLGVSRADRNPSGATVGFSFNRVSRGGYGELTPGMTSRWFFIKTNARSYGTGYASVIDGGVATVESYAPLAAPVPEPFTMVLGAASLAIAAGRRFRKNA